MMENPDAIVVGAGLAGLVATYELQRAGRRVLVLDQEGRQNLGGQAFWSLGGLFLVDSPEQRRMGIRDSMDLALQDWFGSAQFDRDEDYWPRRWAEAYVQFAAEQKRSYVHDLGLRFVPFVGWAERGDGRAGGHGNSVPRFHLSWGTGPRVMEVFRDPVLEAEKTGTVEFAFRHRVDELVIDAGRVVGVRGQVLEESRAARGVASSRTPVGEFQFDAPAIVVSSGGIGGNHELVREHWPSERLGPSPEHMITGVPDYVDGRLREIARGSGADVINADRMWHYTEGITNWDPIWPGHGIRILPGPSSMWFDALGRRMEPPYLPGFDTLATLRRILSTGYDYSWFILNQTIIEKEFALSGSEQNPDITGRSFRAAARSRLAKGAPGPVEAFKERGEDFVVADTIDDLVAKMNTRSRGPELDAEEIERQVVARDRQVANPFGKDFQVMSIRNARQSRSDRLTRTVPPHRILDPAHGPLIGVRLNILTRKSLGGLHTNLNGQVLQPDGSVIEGLYAAGEVSGFGGGGIHGYNALEGTFLGGCIFSGRQAGRAIADTARSPSQ